MWYVDASLISCNESRMSKSYRSTNTQELQGQPTIECVNSWVLWYIFLVPSCSGTAAPWMTNSYVPIEKTKSFTYCSELDRIQ